MINQLTKPIYLIALVLAIILVIGVGIYYFNNNQNAIRSPVVTPPSATQSSVKVNDNLPPPENKPSDNISLKVYFGNSKFNSGQDCQNAYPVDRSVSKTQMVGTAALNELFKGPTDQEKNDGYTSSFSGKTSDALINLQVHDGFAFVNLNDIRSIIPNSSTSCGSAQFFSEVGSTLRQFPTVKAVEYAISGDPKTFYDWMQIGCSTESFYCDNSVYKTSVLKLDNLSTGQVVTNPLTITGNAKGWYFEASFPVKIYDEKGNLLAQSQAQAQSDWTTPNFVAFRSTLSFTAPLSNTGYIVLEKDNPSGLPQNADQATVFVRFH